MKRVKEAMLPGEYVKSLAAGYGTNNWFEPVACWTVTDSKPKRISIIRLRPADNGNDVSWADTTERGSCSTFYLFPRKPFLKQLEDEYGTFNQWVA